MLSYYPRKKTSWGRFILMISIYKTLLNNKEGNLSADISGEQCDISYM